MSKIIKLYSYIIGSISGTYGFIVMYKDNSNILKNTYDFLISANLEPNVVILLLMSVVFFTMPMIIYKIKPSVNEKDCIDSKKINSKFINWIKTGFTNEDFSLFYRDTPSFDKILFLIWFSLAIPTFFIIAFIVFTPFLLLILTIEYFFG